MSETGQHEMVLDGHVDGMEVWWCPTCGRRIYISWPPCYRKIVILPGDETAIHSGGKGGAQMVPPAVVQEQEPEVIDPPEFVDWVDAHRMELETLGGENA